MGNSKSTAKINYAQRLRAIRPFVSFDYDLRKPLNSAQKAQITRYYEYIQKLTVRPHQIYRTASEKNLHAVQRFAQHDTHHPLLKVAFVPNAGDEPMKIKINKKGEVRGKTGHIAVYEIPFNKVRLVREGRKYIEDVIRKGPVVKRYVIQAGEFEVPGAFAPQFIVDEVLKTMERYGSDKYDENDKNSHHHSNWMRGLNGYTFHNQGQLAEYREKKRKLSKIAAAKHVAQKRREKRIQESPPGFWINDTLRAVKRARPPQPDGWREVNQRAYYEAVFKKDYKEIKDR